MFKKIVYVAMIGLVLLGASNQGVTALADSNNSTADLELQIALLEEEAKNPTVPAGVKVAKAETINKSDNLDGFNPDEKLILDVCTKELSLTNIKQLAYILATARHESAQFRTLTEYASGIQYEGRTDLGNTQPGDGTKFKGRGFVQLTGRTNYTLWSGWLDQDLVNNPDTLINDRRQSAFILCSGIKFGSFTGANNGKLESYINDSKTDYYNARRLVNGLDEAQKIANYAKEYEARLANYKPNQVQKTQIEIDLEEKIELQKAIEANDQADLELELEIIKANNPFDPSNSSIIDTSKPQVQDRNALADVVQRFKSDTIGKMNMPAEGVDPKFNGQCVTYAIRFMQQALKLDTSIVGDAKDYYYNYENSAFLKKNFDLIKSSEIEKSGGFHAGDISVYDWQRMAQSENWGHIDIVESTDGQGYSTLGSNIAPIYKKVVVNPEAYGMKDGKWQGLGRAWNSSDTLGVLRPKAFVIANALK